eukprot:6211313-Pleurochrysis_carterae.AAC.4
MTNHGTNVLSSGTGRDTCCRQAAVLYHIGSTAVKGCGVCIGIHSGEGEHVHTSSSESASGTLTAHSRRNHIWPWSEEGFQSGDR